MAVDARRRRSRRRPPAPTAPQDRGQALGRLVHRRRPERSRAVVRRVTGHARVVVAEVLDRGDPEQGGRRLALAAPHPGQPAGRPGRPGSPGATAPSSPPVATTSTTGTPAAARQGHRAAGEDRLVVGMGVHEHHRPVITLVNGVGSGRTPACCHRRRRDRNPGFQNTCFDTNGRSCCHAGDGHRGWGAGAAQLRRPRHTARRRHVLRPRPGDDGRQPHRGRHHRGRRRSRCAAASSSARSRPSSTPAGPSRRRSRSSPG